MIISNNRDAMDGTMNEGMLHVHLAERRAPESTLVVSLNHESRREINRNIHPAMQDAVQAKTEEHSSVC